MTDTLDMFPAPDLFSVATHKAGIPGWQWCASRVINPHTFLVTGGVPRALKSGPNKGRATMKGQPLTEVVVTRAEIDAACAEYEATTGRCRECSGISGRLFRFVTREGVPVVKACPRCNGTGVPTP